jgi:hypothetical protein
MKLSGHEINSQLRQKLEMPTGRHLYVVLGTYERLERYEKVDFREARSPTGQKLAEPVNVNHLLLERIPDDELKRLVQTEASRTESVKDRLSKELDALVASKLNGGSFIALKNLEILFAYDLELNSLRIRAANQKHILLLGVHYSDLFEQYLPVHDKLRRLLADWLPEYFIKTPSGTWRLPNKDEAQLLAELRNAGTLRRIKRFANALIDGVPVREKDRPGSDVDLLDWLRQCRRAGLYEQGRAIYEKGGMNLANLDDEQQIEAEDNYRSCVKHGGEEEAKPKKKRRKMTEDDE